MVNRHFTYKINYCTSKTKVSIDLRIILKKDFEWVIIDNKPIYVGDGIKKAEFRPGHPFGYHEKSIEKLL